MGLSYTIRALGFVWSRGKWWVICSLLIMILKGSLPVSKLWVLQALVNRVTGLIQGTEEHVQGAFLLLALQLALEVAGTTLSGVEKWMTQKMSIVIGHDLQEMVLRKVTSVPLACFDLPEFYNHVSRIGVNGIGGRFMAPIQDGFSIGQSVISLVGLLVYLFTVHWSLVLLALGAAIPMLVVRARYGGQQWQLALRQTPLNRDAQYTAGIMMDRQSAMEVRAFGLVEHLIGRWSAAYRKNAREGLVMLRKQEGGIVLLEGISALFLAVAAGVIIWLTQTSSLEVGQFVAVVQAVTVTQGDVNLMAVLLAQLYQQNLYIRDYYEFLAYERKGGPKRPEAANERFPELVEEGIRFEHVSYQYPESERYVLRDVSFHIRPGEKIAIVGENGSGKTTLVKCLMGLYQPDNGRITFEGVDQARIDRQELSKRITVIFQEFVRYAYTVRENVMLSRSGVAAAQERMRAVSKQAGIDRFVDRFAAGYETHLGRYLADGEDLSGGQWQKVAIARALFHDGDVVILDEPTAALDPLAELDVFRQFNQLTQNKTALFISHRMSAARMADRVFVMKEGRLVEAGTHEELLRLEGAYAEMYRAQAAWFAEQGEEWKEALAWRS